MSMILSVLMPDILPLSLSEHFPVANGAVVDASQRVEVHAEIQRPARGDSLVAVAEK